MFGINLAQNVPALVSIIVFLCGCIYTFGAWYIYQNDKAHDKLSAKYDKLETEFRDKYDAAIDERNELRLEVACLKTKLEGE